LKQREGNKCNLQQELLSYREHNLFNKRKRNAKIIPKQSSVICIIVNQKSPTIPDQLTTKQVLAPSSGSGSRLKKESVQGKLEQITTTDRRIFGNISAFIELSGWGLLNTTGLVRAIHRLTS
jgi:hypothetical protein